MVNMHQETTLFKAWFLGISIYLIQRIENDEHFEPLNLSQETQHILNVVSSLVNMRQIEVYSHI